MKIVYDKETDTMIIALSEDKIKESDEVRPGVIADFGYENQIVRFEILSASKHITHPNSFAYELQKAV
jgi:uncharacterized protein YuzE